MKSFLDQDLYKFTMGQIASQSHADVQYNFVNRDQNNKFIQDFLHVFEEKVQQLGDVHLTPEEKDYLISLRLFNENYLKFLQNFRYNPNQLDIRIVDEQLRLRIEGPWSETIYWEVPLMALISETYFEIVDKNWKWDRTDYKNRLIDKAQLLKGVRFAEFGTRRRRSFDTQDLAVEVMSHYPNFAGTSNVYLAKKYNVNCIGTVAHEFVMAQSMFSNYEFKGKPNPMVHRNSMDRWISQYHGKLGIALTDTYTTKSFLKSFDSFYARLFDGVRQDSGDPFEYGEMIIRHYKSLGINPLYKVIVFSDSLDPEKAVALNDRFSDRINCMFAIGTNLTNDFPGSPALKIVIKLFMFNGQPVVKVSDEPSKASGDPDALKMIKRLHNVE